MKTKEKSKKGKAIIGIAMAAIMIASVMAAMVTPVAAQWVRTPRNVQDAVGVGVPPAVVPGPTIIIGELVYLLGPDGGVNTLDEPTTLQQLQGSPAVPTGYVLTADAITGNFDTTGAPAGTYESNVPALLGGPTYVTLATLTFTHRLQVGTAAVSSCVGGQRIDVVVSSNIPDAIYTLPPLPAATGRANDLKLTIIDTDAGTETNAGVSPGIIIPVAAANYANVDGSGVAVLTDGDIRLPAVWGFSAVSDVFNDLDNDNAVSVGDTWAAVAGTPLGLNQVAAAATVTHLLEDIGGGVVPTAGDIVIGVNIPAGVGIILIGAGLGAGVTHYDVDKDAVASGGDVVVTVQPGTAWTVTTGAGGLTPGDYTFTVETYTTGVAQASINTKTTTKDMTVQVAAITVEVDPTSQTTGNDILITTRAGATTPVTVTITGAGATFDVNKGDYPARAGAGSGARTFIATIPADGKLEAVMSSPTTGAVTVTATIPATGDIDSVIATFTKAVTEVDISVRKIIIGDKVTISGRTTTGVDEVAIFIEDVLQKICPVKADDTYEWEWDTGLVATPKPGSVTIKVFAIHPARPNAQADDCTRGMIGMDLSAQCGGTGTAANINTFYETTTNAARPADASTGLSAVAGDLFASMDVPRVAKEDDIVIYGTAEGEMQVRVLLIESDGTVRSDSYESVLEDGSFEFTRVTGISWPSGTYKAMIITDGRDGTTLLTCSRDITGTFPGRVLDCGAIGDNVGGNLDSDTLLHVAGAMIGGTLVRSMTQNQLIETLDSYILPRAGAAGSDDKRIVLSFKLEEPDLEITEIEDEMIEIDQLSVDVTVTDGALTVKGITNRISDALIMVMAESTVDPKYDLTPATVFVTNGTFTANLDVPEGVTGNYTVIVDDLSRATDELTVEILAEPTATPTPEPTATAEPTEAPAVPTPEPTAEPTPTPEEPGFEAVFAIAGLLSIAYLLVLKKRK